MAGARRRNEGLAEALARVAAAPTSAVRASGRARKPAKPSSRVLVESCPHGPGTGLCRLCGWEGHRVPRAWAELPPGTPYEGASKLIGQKVKLRGDELESVVIGLATPVGPSLLQTGRLSRRASCEGAFIVRTKLGAGFVETPVRKSVVRERRRLEERGQCPDAAIYSSAAALAASVAEIEREAARNKKGKTPFELVGFELPYPHRIGSSPCCWHSPRSVPKLRAMVERYRDEGEESDFDAAAVALRKALPRGVREVAKLDTAADLSRALREVEAHCWAQWEAGAGRAGETKKAYLRRAREAAKERKRLELAPARSARKARALGDFALGAELVELGEELGDVSFDVAEFV